MVFSRYDNDALVKASKLTKVAFWVQVYDIPLRFRTRGIAKQICEPVGKILHPNEATNWDRGSFIRVECWSISLSLFVEEDS